MNFNFFTILSKDDKELIHSSFIRFLLKDPATSPYVLSKLFGDFKNTLNRDAIELEKVYSYKIEIDGATKSKRVRLDIEGVSEDEKSLLVIENKFKSFPYIEQLEVYDARLAENHEGKTFVKYLLCFDKDIIPFEKEGWHFISYRDLLDTLQDLLLNTDLEADKKRFIEHYVAFLSEKFVQYGVVKQACGHLFFDARNDENKFWIRHINAIARLKLQSYFDAQNIAVRFTVNPGNTNVPLLDIFPRHWNKKGRVDTLIQIQGRSLKYYYHANDHAEFNTLLEKARRGITNATGKFNKENPKRGSTNFIYQETWAKSIKEQPFGVDDFVKGIIEFYEKIDAVARNRFS